MASAPPSSLFRQFIDDELLRAPLLFEQVIEGTHDAIRRALPAMNTVQRSAMADVVQALPKQRGRMAEYFMHSLREQVQTELSRQHSGTATPRPAAAPRTLALVDEDEVAIDVELSHTIEGIKSEAEYELRELQTFVAALVGDVEMSRDHNPFRPEAWARATWAACQALPLSRGHQIACMRHASKPLAQLLRTSFAASSSRLEGMGVEPASYRTLILPSGSRRGGGRRNETTFAPDLYRMRETMPGPLDALPAAAGPELAPRGAGRPEHWTEVARGITGREERQSIELVSRLFEAMQADTRVPADVGLLISRLHGPGMRLALRDRTLLDQDRHPLWRFINLLAFHAEMTPTAGDPERLQLLRLAQATIDQLASEPVQNTGLYRWALETLEAFLHKRLTRRLAGVASQIGALQKLEERPAALPEGVSTQGGPLDHHQLDTVPAEFMDTAPPDPGAHAQAAAWLQQLQPGQWVRMFFEGRWTHAQLLWLGQTRAFVLFGDGASDATWAVRAGALQMMNVSGLAKSLKIRSIVGSAAARVQEQLAVRLPA